MTSYGLSVGEKRANQSVRSTVLSCEHPLQAPCVVHMIWRCWKTKNRKYMPASHLLHLYLLLRVVMVFTTTCHSQHAHGKNVHEHLRLTISPSGLQPLIFFVRHLRALTGLPIFVPTGSLCPYVRPIVTQVSVIYHLHAPLEIMIKVFKNFLWIKPWGISKHITRVGLCNKPPISSDWKCSRQHQQIYRYL